ncbi:RNA polymerase sigma factor [Kordiimonas lipolytica]|uniref:RNA polymerase sigma factor n=1 Tax=Kordiimonas lipolytica TaxID=1662421 RepID=A0ABV8U918_9PROT|nr:RNA polymerase sigma factor [Kordiimonas lipolytica]
MTSPERQKDEQETAEGASPSDDARALSQDEIKALFKNHNEELVRYLTSRLKSHEEAVEVAQEAYVRLLRLDDTSTIGFLRAFLFRTATNIAIDRIRRKGLAQSYVDQEAPQQVNEMFGFTPERSIAAKQALARVLECVSTLPPKCRHAFVEYKFKNRSYDDIAQEMGLTSSMIRKYVLRALVHCSDKMSDELDAWSL